MEELNLEELIAQIVGSDEDARAEAWLGAAKFGAAAIRPLAKVADDDNIDITRAARRAMWKIVRNVGRPGADAERKAVEAELCGLLDASNPAVVRREVLWMLSEIGGSLTLDTLRDLPGILDDKEVREDARCCVERIPGDAATYVLQDALDGAPIDFKLQIAQSLRARGVEVPGLPCQKLVPTKQTQVKPVGR